MYISKSMPIKSIVEQYPETIPVFTNIGFKGLDNPGVLEIKQIKLPCWILIKIIKNNINRNLIIVLLHLLK